METNKLILGNIGKKQIPLLKGRTQKLKEGEYAFLAEAEIGKECIVVCPACRKFVVLNPLKRVNSDTCKACNTVIRYCAKGKEQKEETVEKDPQPVHQKIVLTQKPDVSTPLPKAQLVWGCFYNRKKYPIKLGENIVGRADSEMPSDLQINDDYASRRSVKIEPIMGPQGYSFKLTVLNASNPVIVKNESRPVGTEVYLNYDDSFILGSTTITLKKI